MISNILGVITSANPLDVRTIGSTFVEQLDNTDAASGVLTFADNIVAIEIFNTDAVNAGTFEVNGISIIIPAAKSFKGIVGGTPGKTVTVADATTYVVTSFV